MGSQNVVKGIICQVTNYIIYMMILMIYMTLF